MRRYSLRELILPILTPSGWPLPAPKTFWNGATAKSPSRKPLTTAPKSQNAMDCSASAFLAQSKISTRMTPNTKGVRSREAAVDKNGEIVTKALSGVSAWATLIWLVRSPTFGFCAVHPSAIGLLLGMTVKNLERIAYFASYIIKSVDTDKRDQMLADKEAEFAAAKEAKKVRYERSEAAERRQCKSSS